MKLLLPLRTSANARELYLPVLGFVLTTALLALLWLGYKATDESRRSRELLGQQRTSEVALLMVLAMNRDMRAVQLQVLPQIVALGADASPYDLSDEIGQTFAKFPYPESFFRWTCLDQKSETLYVFNRADRPPPWQPHEMEAHSFPTIVLRDPPELSGVRELLRSEGRKLEQFIAFETTIGGETYQVVAQPQYEMGTRLQSMVGFLVNLDWVRKHYFSEMTLQLSRILANQSHIALTVLDEGGNIATTNRPQGSDATAAGLPASDRHFALLFFDPALRSTVKDGAMPLRTWTARAETIDEASIFTMVDGSHRTFVLISIATIVSGIALILAIQTARASALLASMKSEFVSAVTHELKTPLSSIRLASETLIRGRYRSQEAVADYAALLLNDVSRLTRTVDNLLSITRVQDTRNFYLFEPIDLLTTIEEVLGRFHFQLKQQGFLVQVDVPTGLPPIRADRAALRQILDNIFDNAIRYAGEGRFLRISAAQWEKRIRIRVEDRGPGIPTDELPRVFDKFFRGRGASAAGSGLGLAITRRLLHDHDGDIQLFSSRPAGTTVEFSMCLAQGE